MRTTLPGFMTFIVCFSAISARGQDDAPLTRLYDTATPLAGPLTDDLAAKRAGWQQVAEDVINHGFTGDAVMMNDKLAIVFRKQGPGPDIYSKAANGYQHRATLNHAAGPLATATSADGLKIIENTSGGAAVEVAFKGGEAASLRFRLTTGEAILEIRSNEGTGFVETQTRSRYVVVPDYFGDDMVYGSEAFDGLCLPAENFALHLIDGGESIMMSVWQSNEQDTWLAEPRRDAGKGLCSTRIRCLRDKSVWLAFLEAPGLWHAADKPAVSDGKPPFAAKWRCSFVRENGQANSWDAERGPSPEQNAAKHKGPAITYPIDRSIATPLTMTCPTDIMRNTLGVGPCQYILACEGMAAQGDPTPNSVMTWVEKQFEQKKDKKGADDIKERLDQMTRHVGRGPGEDRSLRRLRGPGARSAGRQGTDRQCDRSTILNAVPRPAGLRTLRPIERRNWRRSRLSALIRKDNAATACRPLGEQLRSIGAVQDRALATCRMNVRRLMQQSKTILAKQEMPAAEPAREIQRLAEDMLRNK